MTPMDFRLFPAIDLKDGQAVRLRQGRADDATVYYPDPAEAAARWLAAGTTWLHVVDLDGAFSGTPRNLAAIQAICAAARVAGAGVQVGGGLRDLAAIDRALQAGADRVIIGSKALGGDLVPQAIRAFGAQRVICGIDAKGGLVATEGWVNVSAVTALELAQRLAALGITEVVYTDIARDGMLGGPNFAATEALAHAAGLGVIASGGVSSLADIARLRGILGVTGAILGKALYEGQLDLQAALRA